MLSAPDRRQHPIDLRAVPPVRPVAITSIAPQAATISTARGEFLSGGTARLRERVGGWTAVLSGLSQPGLVASKYFADGLRDVVLRLEDGRRARARIAATRFTAGERVCEVVGLEPLR